MQMVAPQIRYVNVRKALRQEAATLGFGQAASLGKYVTVSKTIGILGKTSKKKLERGTTKISAPENRIMYAIYAFVLTPRDNDLVNPVFGPVLTAPLRILTKHGWTVK